MTKPLERPNGPAPWPGSRTSFVKSPGGSAQPGLRTSSVTSQGLVPPAVRVRGLLRPAFLCGVGVLAPRLLLQPRSCCGPSSLHPSLPAARRCPPSPRRSILSASPASEGPGVSCSHSRLCPAPPLSCRPPRGHAPSWHHLHRGGQKVLCQMQDWGSCASWHSQAQSQRWTRAMKPRGQKQRSHKETLTPDSLLAPLQARRCHPPTALTPHLACSPGLDPGTPRKELDHLCSPS